MPAYGIANTFADTFAVTFATCTVVILFPKSNKTFSRYFDPSIISIDNNKILGDLTFQKVMHGRQ